MKPYRTRSLNLNVYTLNTERKTEWESKTQRDREREKKDKLDLKKKKIIHDITRSTICYIRTRSRVAKFFVCSVAIIFHSSQKWSTTKQEEHECLQPRENKQDYTA